ncbi:MAG TPA: amidohydrolase family protein, partial [Abditibacterium sp.]
ADASGLLYEAAPQGIKFALGENPTRSIGRFPNTRMGMEQLYRERFLAALDYDRKWADFRSGKSRDEPRRDLQLEAISEILSGKRLVHSHGYRQDEFLMLMRLCEEFGVKIRTFQHVLEGYKVADEMAKHGVGGSTFSDWWAFKVEAQDAIPYNGALMAQRGVLVSFNSDDGDLARRLNLEAAKAVKYGGMPPAEALKFVTINPARQLGIDKTTGSLEEGKDADVVLWSGDPLSVYSKCEETWVEGVRRFSRAADLAQRAKVEAEKKALLDFEGVKPKPETAPAIVTRTIPKVAAAKMVAPAAPVFRPVSASTPVQAIVGATVHTVSGASINDGVVVMRGTQILAVGPRSSTKIPRGTQVIQAQGMHVSPGYIDAHTTLGLNEIESLSVTRDFREMGDFNPNVRAEIAVNPDSTLIPVARANGVLSTVAMPEGGLLAGNSALLRLQGWTWEDLTIRRGLGMTLSFPSVGPRTLGSESKHEQHDLCESEESEFDRDDGMRALTGEAMAQAPATPTTPTTAAPTTVVPAPAAPPLTTPENPAPSDKSQPEGRQPATTEKRDELEKDPADDTALEPLNRYFDEAERYRKSVSASSAAKAPLSDRDVKLAALIPVLEGREPLFVQVGSAAEVRAALSWAKRRGLQIVLFGNGESLLEVAPAIVAANIPVVLGPVLSYPERADEAYDVNYSLPARLKAAGVKFALSSGGDASNVRRLPDQAAMAACFGLPREAALRSITLDAAEILGVSNRLGSLEAGKDATLILTSGDPLEITSQVKMAWIEGAPVDLANKHLALYERYRSRPRKP